MATLSRADHLPDGQAAKRASMASSQIRQSAAQSIDELHETTFEPDDIAYRGGGGPLRVDNRASAAVIADRAGLLG